MQLDKSYTLQRSGGY